MSDDEFLRRLRMGIQVTDTFNYKGIEIKFRALSTSEFDEARYHSLTLLNPLLTSFLLKLRLQQFSEKEIDITKGFPPEIFDQYFRYLKESNYWIVYYGLKEFRDESFSIEDVRKMSYIHKLAEKIIELSTASPDRILGLIKTIQGVEIGRMVFKFNIPISSDINKVTPLQFEFLKRFSDGDKYISNDEIGDKFPHLKEVMDKFGEHK